MTQKTTYLFNDKEIYNYEDYELQRRLSPILRILPARFGVIFPLALASLAALPYVGRQRRKAYALQWLYVGAFGGAVALYYTSGRMRMPLAFPITALAGLGFAVLMYLPARRRILAAVLLVTGISLAWGDWWGVRSESMAHVDLARMSNAAWHRGKYDQALQFALAADRIAPSYPALPRLKAQALYGLGRLQESAAEFERSVELLHDETSRRNLEIVRQELAGETSATTSTTEVRH